MVSESPGISRPATPAWIDHAIWWQVYPLGATGAPIRPEPGTPLTEPGAPARLDRLEPWLDYAVEHEGQAPGAAGLGETIEGGVVTQAGVDAQVVGGVVAVGG